MADELFEYFQRIRLGGTVRRREWYWKANAHRPKPLAYALEYEPFTLLLKVGQYIRRRRALAPLTCSRRPTSAPLQDSDVQLLASQDRPGLFAIDLPGYTAAPPVGNFAPVSHQLRLISGNRNLILVHAHFQAEAAVIFEKLRAFSDYDQVITTSVPAVADAFLDQASLAHCACILVRNVGRDVLPFLLCARYLDLSGYDYFLKLHTKRSTHLGWGQTWFGMNVEALLGNKAMTDQLLARIDNGRPSLYGLECASLRDHFRNNRHWLRHLTGRSAGRPRGHFIPGTMFAGTGQYLRELAKLELHLQRFEETQTQLDGCLIHALERLFGYLAVQWGGECRSIESLLAEPETSTLAHASRHR